MTPDAGIAVRPLAPGAALHVAIAPAQPVSDSVAARIQGVWAELRAANDRYYDGPILRVLSVDHDSGEILCRRDSFRSLAASARLGLGVRQLGVCGVLVGRDAVGGAGDEHVLLARRSTETRIYPGLWELAPSGGVPPPAPSIAALALPDLALALAAEAEEELGLDLEAITPALLALVRDEAACSDDAVLRFDLPDVINPSRSLCAVAAEAAGRWEYIDSAWVARRDLAAFVEEHAAAIAPPTRAILKWLDWA